tara:strand:+ start:1575 stop:2171 length:597 start_codon:yes stop_codon:yes gene_type:complete
VAEYIVAITGGIGSGKSAVGDRFESLGIRVVDMDVASRVVVEPGRPALAAIAERFGEGMLNGDGTLDRRALREHIFANKDERMWLNALTHPLINAWVADELTAATSPYAIVINPLLVRKDAYVNRILVVDVPVETQIERTMARDDVDRKQAESIVASQIGREKRLDLADDVIENTGDLDALLAPVQGLHEQYVEAART